MTQPERRGRLEAIYGVLPQCHQLSGKQQKLNDQTPSKSPSLAKDGDFLAPLFRKREGLG